MNMKFIVNIKFVIICSVCSFSEVKGNCDSENVVRCSSSHLCIPLHWVCDGEDDCPDGWDENVDDCDYGYKHHCNVNQFRCGVHGNGICIEDEMLCDGKSDCADGSDEDILRCDDHVCLATAFKCTAYKKCIANDLVCNGRNDCGNGDTSDEDWASCRCNHTFHAQPCKCPPGNRIVFSADGFKSCDDIDECSGPNNNSDRLRSQSCENFEGGYRCTCLEGYQLKSDNKSCELTSPLLLYKWQSVLMVSNLDFASLDLLNVHLGLGISGYDIDSHSKTIYWTSAVGGLIGSHNIDDKDDRILFRDLSRPTLIAFDWVSRNVFVFAISNNLGPDAVPVIMICSVKETDGRGCATLYKLRDESAGATVTGMTIEPNHGHIFFSLVSYENKTIKHESKNGSIWSAKTDGLNISILVSEMVQNPTGLAIDHVFNRIFWIDSSTRTVESMSFDGTDRTIVIRMFNREWGIIQSLAVFEDQVIWFDKDEMFRCTVHSRQNTSSRSTEKCSSLAQPFLFNAQFPKILHPVLQSFGAEPPCDTSLCRFICTSTNVTRKENFTLASQSRIKNNQGQDNNPYKCICPDGYVAQDSLNINCTRSIASQEDSHISSDHNTQGKNIGRTSGEDCSCATTSTTAYVIVTIVVILTVSIFLVQCLIYCFHLRRRKVANDDTKSHQNQNLVRRYIDLHRDSVGFQVETPMDVSDFANFGEDIGFGELK